MSDRDGRIDTLKGFLIISVVLGHLPNFCHYYGVKNSSFEIVYAILLYLVYFYNTELFFSSSILFVKEFSLSFLRKRAITIMLPFVFWFFARQVFKVLVYGTHFKIIIKETTQFWLGSFYYLGGPLWFLSALFTTVILFSLYLKYKNRNLNWAIAYAWIALFVFSNKVTVWHNNGLIPFGIDVFLFLFPLFILIRHIYTKELWKKVKWYQIVVALFFSVQGLFFFEPLKEGLKPVDIARFSVPSTFFGFISFMVVCVAIFITFIKSPPLKVLKTVGYFSMPVYLMHYYVIIAGWTLFKKLMIFDTSFLFVYSLIILVLGVLLPILISKWLMKVSEKFRYIGMVK